MNMPVNSVEQFNRRFGKHELLAVPEMQVRITFQFDLKLAQVI